MRVSCLCAVPGCACRGRYHTRVSPSVVHFKERGGGLCYAMVFTLGNNVAPESSGCFFFFLEIIFYKHLFWFYIICPVEVKGHLLAWDARPGPLSRSFRCVVFHMWNNFLICVDCALCCCCWWCRCCCSDPVSPQGSLKLPMIQLCWVTAEATWRGNTRA